MAPKKDLLAKVFGTRLSNRLRGTNAKQNGSQHNKYHTQDPDEEAEAELRRPSTAPSRDAPRKSSYKKNPPPPIQTRFDRDNMVGLAMSSDSSDHEQGEANSDGGQPRSRHRRRQQQPQQELQRPRTAPNGSSASSSSHRITIASSSPPPVPSLTMSAADLSPRRLSRRTSLKQRFWSANPSNSFLELDPASPSFPKGNGGASSASRARSVYMPRHAATDFSKTALSRRTSVHARASERIARRFSSSEDNDDDAKTLCSINCREEQDPEQITRDLDLWLATLRRQQAAMKAAPANSSSSSTSAEASGCTPSAVSAEEQLQVQQHVVQQAKFLQCPPPPSPLSPNGTFTSCCTTGTSPGSNYSHAAATESESDDEYGVFSQLQAETKSKTQSKAQARAALRCSTIITTAPSPVDNDDDAEYTGGGLFGSAPSPMLDDPILHRSSTYGKNPLALPPSPSPRRSNTTARPKSLTASRSPRMSTFVGGARPPVPIVTPGAGAGPLMTDYLEPSSRPRSSIARTSTAPETRRTSCTKTPAVTTIVEAS